MTVVEEKDLLLKVGELMTTLDEVKKYKELAKSLVDFVLILLSSIIMALFVYIGFNLYQAGGGQILQGVIIGGIEGIIFLILIGGSFILCILWVNRRVQKTKVGEWKKELEQESTLGAMKILAEMDWPSVFQDIRYSKIGFVFYSILKVIGYWILTLAILVLASDFGLSILHIIPDFTYFVILSLIIALILSRKDLQRRYNQSWALDSLLWELRWFDSEFRGKAEFGTAAKT